MKKKLHIIIFLLHFQKYAFILPHIVSKANHPPPKLKNALFHVESEFTNFEKKSLYFYQLKRF
jgi:hypothetical protein